MEPEGSLPHSHVPATCPYPDPVEKQIRGNKMWHGTEIMIGISWAQQWIHYIYVYMCVCVCGYLCEYSDWLRAGPSRDRILVGTRFSAPVQTGPRAHPASCTMDTGSFPGVKCVRGVLLTTHPLLVPRSWRSRALPLPTLWATPGL
jgi:hypothetical protein